MREQKIRLLIVDQNPADVAFIIQTIRPYQERFVWEHVTTLAKAKHRLREGFIDLMLLDPVLTGHDNTTSLAPLLSYALDVPTIVLSRVDNEALGMDAIRQGAQDFLWKRQLAPELLIRCMFFALERHQQRYRRFRLAAQDDLTGNARRPHWDPRKREFRVGLHLVKQFRQPSPNQERILAVFQEDGWPVKIDDPLLPEEEIDPKERLRATIRSLNSHQHRKLIRFSADGTGRAVIWELLSVPAQTQESSLRAVLQA